MLWGAMVTHNSPEVVTIVTKASTPLHTAQSPTIPAGPSVYMRGIPPYVIGRARGSVSRLVFSSQSILHTMTVAALLSTNIILSLINSQAVSGLNLAG
jgi:hypothetical protein